MTDNAPNTDPLTGTKTTGHVWDGIQELNTPLPRWWLWMFYATIIWSVGYWIVYPSWPLVNTYARGLTNWHARDGVIADIADLKRERGPLFEKLGSASLLAAIEPLTGRRLAHVCHRRTKREFTQFCQALAGAYPQALKIRLVLDNLNTHNASSFYEHLSAEDAFALAQRFEFIYTPKGASWLNMIECEFSVISRQCLDRRIATIERLRSEVLTLVEERSAKAIKIRWQFSIQAARSNFNRHYTRINPANQKYNET